MSLEPMENQDRTLEQVAQLVDATISGAVPEHVHAAGRERLRMALARETKAPRYRAAWIVAAAAIAVLAVGASRLARLRAPAELTYTIAGAAVSEGGYVHGADANEGATIKFSDGSEVSLSAGTRGRVAGVEAHGARIALENGGASVHVIHRPDTKWSVDAGPFVIKVTGTEFDVRWSGADEVLDVRMKTGSVNISGPSAPDGIVLHTGQRLVATLRDGKIAIEGAGSESPAHNTPVEGQSAEPPSSDPLGASGAAVRPSDVGTASPLGANRSSSPAAPANEVAQQTWTKRVAAGDHQAVLQEAEARGLDACMKQSSLGDLAALADAGRYAKRTDVARRALAAERSRFPSSPEAHTAAFLLGRLADDSSSLPDAAIGWYDTYLSESPNGPLASEALGRKMIVLKRMSQSDKASAAAEEYLRRFSRGPYAARARELVLHSAP
jgi:TolA-binding protein